MMQINPERARKGEESRHKAEVRGQESEQGALEFYW